MFTLTSVVTCVFERDHGPISGVTQPDQTEPNPGRSSDGAIACKDRGLAKTRRRGLSPRRRLVGLTTKLSRAVEELALGRQRPSSPTLFQTLRWTSCT